MTVDDQQHSRDDAASLGARVKAARESAGLTLAEVSDRTRVRATVLAEIERDDFSHCGGDVYAKGHLRAIASAVGVDARPWIERYDDLHGTAAPSATEVFESETAVSVRRTGVNWSAIMAAALVVAVGLVVVQVTSSSDDPARDTTTVAEPEPTPTESEAEPSTEPTQVAEAERQDVTVRLVAIGTGSWVQVSRPDGAVIFTETLPAGESKTFRDDKRLDFVIGNAAGVELTVNGEDIGSPGASGEVARVSFTPKDPDGAAG